MSLSVLIGTLMVCGGCMSLGGVSASWLGGEAMEGFSSTNWKDSGVRIGDSDISERYMLS